MDSGPSLPPQGQSLSQSLTRAVWPATRGASFVVSSMVPFLSLIIAPCHPGLRDSDWEDRHVCYQDPRGMLQLLPGRDIVGGISKGDCGRPIVGDVFGRGALYLTYSYVGIGT